MGWQDRPYNREDGGGVPSLSFRFPPFTTLTVAIIVACVLMFALQSFTRPQSFEQALAHGPRGAIVQWLELTFAGGRAFTQPWRLITYQYLHADSGHIFWNMLILYLFLPTLEGFWGWKKALAFYTLGGVFSGLTYGLLTLFSVDNGLIGASGAIFAALGAVALMSPSRQIWLFFFSIPIRVFAGLIAAFFLLTIIGEGNLSNAAHLGGLAFGFFAPWIGGPVVDRVTRQWRDRQAGRAIEQESALDQKIDRILAKVSVSGMNSLSGQERRTLKKASERQRVGSIHRR